MSVEAPKGPTGISGADRFVQQALETGLLPEGAEPVDVVIALRLGSYLTARGVPPDEAGKIVEEQVKKVIANRSTSTP